MKTAWVALFVMIVTVITASAQYSSYPSDSDSWRAQQDANYQIQKSNERIRDIERRAASDRWQAETQARYATEAADRSTRAAENALWQAEQRQRNW